MEMLILICAYTIILYIVIGFACCLVGLWIALFDFEGLLKVVKYHDPKVYGWLQSNPLHWKAILVTLSLLATCFWMVLFLSISPLIFKGVK